MSCSFYAYPESSVDIIWLVDYNNQRWPRGGARPGRSALPGAEDRIAVLYDSKLHLQQRRPGPDSWLETPLHGNRVLVRESRASSLLVPNSIRSGQPEPVPNRDEIAVLKETQIIIQAAHVDDSAR